MVSILIVIGSFLAYLVAYRTYGRFIGHRIFALSASAVTPAHALQDNLDYVPTNKEVLFGHHFTSIAGVGPIVGPAIAVIWGWLPALIWILVGSIFMGAVHDLGALIISVRQQGKSIGEISAGLINPRVRVLLLLIIFFCLLIVLAIFGMIIAALFDMYPQAVLPVWFEIPIALWLGYMIYQRKASPWKMGIIAVFIMYVTVIIGAYVPIKMPGLFGLSPLTCWIIILFIYAYIASILPVGRLLQPRDYINGHELIIAIVLLLLGVAFAHPAMAAPVVDLHPQGAPPIFPFIFITIACGAISGFHSLVSSGTSSKQLAKETHALPIGYGGMLMEAVLATLVIIAVAAGIGDKTAWNVHYASWAIAEGLNAKVSAFVEGSANMLTAFWIPRNIALAIMGVFVASFACTTLDTATRIQRYVISELAGNCGIKPLVNRYSATLLAVLSALVLALLYEGGKGGLILWPLFGTTNQLLAALVFLLLCVYLAKKGKPTIYTLLPMLFMLGMTSLALVSNLNKFLSEAKWYLFIIGVIILALEVWLIVEAVINYVVTKKSPPRRPAEEAGLPDTKCRDRRKG